MENVIIIAVLLCIVSGSIFYLQRVKKRGAACMGCPCAKRCGGTKCGERASKAE